MLGLSSLTLQGSSPRQGGTVSLERREWNRMLSPATSSIAFNGYRNLLSLRSELKTPEPLKLGAISAAGKA